MFGIKKKQKKFNAEKQLSKLNKSLDDYELSTKIQENLDLFNNLFKDNDEFKIRKIVNDSKQIECHVAFLNSMVDSKIINESIIKPLFVSEINLNEKLLSKIANEIIYIDEICESNDIKKIVASITSGNSVLFLDNEDKVLILNTKGFSSRPISEPDSEKILSGPKEGFTETLKVNVSLLQKKVRTNQLKIKYMEIGEQTNTNICVCYIDSVVDKTILNNLYKRLKNIDIDSILDSNYIVELISDGGYSPFKKIGITERPDVVIGKLLEGRIGILVDGTPVALTLPYLFVENFQSPEDYYLSSDYSSISRIIRMIGFFLTISVPSLYIAIFAFHQEMIPTSLFINVAMERQSAPLPAGLEAVVMLVVFELLRETGIRMPSNIGHALSIVGALVIGQAAVEAELVAAPMIIVVGITGITGLLIPKLSASVLIYRFSILFFTIIIGFLGFVLGLSIMLIHILNLKSFNVSQVARLGSFKSQDLKDIVVRKSWKDMITRPKYLTNNQVRQKKYR